MSLTKVTTNLNNISSLDDKPSIESDELKTLFDKAGNDLKTYINETLTEELDTLIASKYTELNNSIIANANTITTAQLNKIYPIGSIYMSVNSTSPASFIGGTWERIQDKFLLASGSTYANGSTGGEATHTLTTSEMPSHTHIFTGVAHSHGLGSHTHTYYKANTTSGSTALTINQIPSHNHRLKRKLASADGISHTNITSWTDTQDIWDSDKVTSSVGGGQGHTHTISSTNISTGAATGSTAGATATGTNSSVGGNVAHNNMPPYLAVYVWKRTA